MSYTKLTEQVLKVLRTPINEATEDGEKNFLRGISAANKIKKAGEVIKSKDYFNDKDVFCDVWGKPDIKIPEIESILSAKGFEKNGSERCKIKINGTLPMAKVPMYSFMGSGYGELTFIKKSGENGGYIFSGFYNKDGNPEYVDSFHTVIFTKKDLDKFLKLFV